MYKLFIAIGIVCGFASCQSENEFDGRYIRVDKPSGINMSCSPVACDIPGAVDGFVVDSFYVFYTMQHPDHRFEVCDLHTMEPIQTLVNVGRGPGEYTYLQCNGRFTHDEKGCGIWFYAGQKQELVRLNLTESRIEGKTCLDNRMALDERSISDQAGLTGQLFASDRINDSLAIFQLIQGTKVVRGIYDFKRQQILNKFDFDKQSSKEPNLTGGPIDVRPDARKVVMLPMYFDQINLCDADGGNRFSVSTAKQPITLSQVENSERSERKMYYLDVETTSERIVALYRNHKTQTQELHLFDWNGNLLHVFTLDRPVRSISLHRPTGCLYGFVSSEEICKTDLKQWL